MTSDKSKTVPYTKWTSEQFKAEIAKYPEYAEIADDFTAYWTEPTPKGKMLFQTQKAWDTKRRLSTWKRNEKKSEPKKPKRDPKLEAAGYRFIESLGRYETEFEKETREATGYNTYFRD